MKPWILSSRSINNPNDFLFRWFNLSPNKWNENVQVTRTRSNQVCEKYQKGMKLLVVESDVSGQRRRVKNHPQNWWASHYYGLVFFSQDMWIQGFYKHQNYIHEQRESPINQLKQKKERKKKKNTFSPKLNVGSDGFRRHWQTDESSWLLLLRLTCDQPVVLKLTS